MRKFSWLAAVGLAAVLAMVTPALAAPILVNDDSGNIGSFTFTNEGVLGTTAVIGVGVPSVTSQMNTVNGAVIPPEPAAVSTPLTLLVAPTGPGTYVTNIAGGSATKTIGGTLGQQAQLAFNLDTGSTPLNQPDFFNSSGPILSLLSNNNPLYDFLNFAKGGIINMTFTATSFTGTTSFAGLFATPGASAIGNGAFSQAVPEPASLVMMGIGLLGTFLASRMRHHFV